MTHNRTTLLMTAAIVCATLDARADEAQLFKHLDGNLILAFQATGGTGSSQNVFLDLGPATALRNNGNLGVLGNIGQTLATTYGTDWFQRTNLYCGVIANLNAHPNSGIGSRPAINGDPSRTFYLSAPAATPGTGVIIPAGTYSSSALGAAGTNLNGLDSVLTGGTSIYPNDGGLIAQADGAGVLDATNPEHVTAWKNCWTRWNPTPGAAFEYFTGGIQQSFGQSASSIHLDIQRVLSTNTGAAPTGVVGGGVYVSTISISSSGVVTAAKASGSSPFTTWIGTYNPPLTNGADREPAADPDKDGIENLMEFVLNGNPTVSSQSILPMLNASGANFVFGFTRRADSAGEATQVFESSADLVDWTTKAPVTIPTTPGTYGFVTVGASTGTAPNQVQAITITIPKGSDTRIFGRLKVSK